MTVVSRALQDRVVADLEQYPVVTLLGARQVGKTTLARRIATAWPGQSHTFDLKDIRDLNRLRDIPLALDALVGLVVIDEIQRKPELFSYLRVLPWRGRSTSKKRRFSVTSTSCKERMSSGGVT